MLPDSLALDLTGLIPSDRQDYNSPDDDHEVFCLPSADHFVHSLTFVAHTFGTWRIHSLELLCKLYLVLTLE